MNLLRFLRSLPREARLLRSSCAQTNEWADSDPGSSGIVLPTMHSEPDSLGARDPATGNRV